MADVWMHTPHPTPLDPPLAISYRSHQKSLAHFSHVAPLILFFFTKKRSQKGEDMTQCPLKYAPAARGVKQGIASLQKIFFKNQH